MPKQSEKIHQRCATLAPRQKKCKFKNKLYSLDTSIFDLCLSVFPWTEFRLTGIKQHVALDHGGYVSPCASITVSA